MRYANFTAVLFAALWLMPTQIRAQTAASAPIVRLLHISGNEGIATGELKALMVTRSSAWYDFLPYIHARRYDSATFVADLERLRAHYRNLGYLDVEVDSAIERLGADEIQLGVRIAEGPLTRIARASVMGGEDIEQVFGQLEGAPLSRDLIGASVSQVLSALRDRGYAFARGEVETEILEDRADLVLHLAPGPVCSVRAIRIFGNDAVPEQVILRGLTFKAGTRFRERALRNSQHQLYRAGVFRSVVLDLADSVAATNQVDVRVRVSERPFWVSRLGAGYDTDEDFWASGEVTHRNFAGGARQLQLSGRVSEKNREATLGVRQPYFFSSRNYLHVSGFVQRERQAAFSQDEVGVNFSLERNITPTNNLIAQFSGGVVDFSADSAFAETKVRWLWDTRDDIFDPQSGALTQLTVRERGRFFRADSEFLQATAEGRWFHPIPWRSVLALRVQGGAIFELGNPGNVPNVERFFAGGLNSVRGWRLNDLGPKDAQGDPTGGLSRTELSVEIRTQMFFSWGTAIFLDAGNVDPGLHAFNPQNLKWAIGAGLRYLSPIGPVRLDIAYRLSEDPTAGQRLQYHISLGQAF